jgi:hypothetical protein
MMNDDRELQWMRRRLKTAMPPWTDLELEQDLWPQMLRRIHDAPVAFGWIESILVGTVVVTITVFPELIPMMLFHL